MRFDRSLPLHRIVEIDARLEIASELSNDKLFELIYALRSRISFDLANMDYVIELIETRGLKNEKR